MFTITLNFVGGLTSSQEAAFSQAKATWESIITGYQSGITLSGISVWAEGTAIDGGGGILAMAGISQVTRQAGWTLSTSGSMVFDSADLPRLEASGQLASVITHEMGHVLGFDPRIWQSNGVYVPGSGRYTGQHGLDAYRVEFGQPEATSVPVELGGGWGTADAHWAKDFFGSELMTGWLSPDPYISQTTVASFQDIGYATRVVVLAEPSTLIAFACCAITYLYSRCRQR